MPSPLQAYLEQLHARLKGIDAGAVVSYIPELTRADPSWFGICLVTVDGVAYAVGDADQPFTIQSISKPFVYATGLADRGQEFVSRRVGVEPSGDAFNSISLDPRTGAPLNPMINAGAIASAALVAGEDAAAQWRRIEQSLALFMGHEVAVDEAVYRSESETGFRNRAIAWMLKNFGIIDGEPMAALENYFRQCSVLVTCKDLAYMAATLANGGVHPRTGQRALPAGDVERVLSVMATCGMYDYAGSWLYEVGLPAKSGVGGGIIAVLPGRFGIGIFSPPLDEKGNSVRGIEVCKHLSRDFGLHVFNQARHPALALGRVYTGADAPSRRERAPAVRDYLREHPRRIRYLCLQGELALDGIEYIIRRMTELAPESSSFILDMSQVEAVSEPAARLLHQARLGLRDDDVAVVFSRLRRRKGVLDVLSRAVPAGDHGFLCFEDNDLAVEWCENRLLGDAAGQSAAVPLAGNPLFAGLPPDLLARVEALTRLEGHARGARILAAGAAGDGRLFFVLEGTVSVLVPLPEGGHQRIATLGPGMAFGEMVLLGQATRSASVVADSDVVCRTLTVADVEALARVFPEVKIRLLENLSRDLAQKLRRANEWIGALA